MKHKIWKRLTSLALAVLLAACLLPAFAVAAEADGNAITLAGSTFTASPGEGFALAVSYTCDECEHTFQAGTTDEAHSLEIMSFSYRIGAGSFAFEISAHVENCKGGSATVTFEPYSAPTYCCTEAVNKNVTYVITTEGDDAYYDEINVSLTRAATAHQGDATCHEAKNCALCNTAYTLPHTFGQWQPSQEDSEQHERACQTAGCAYKETASCEFAPATCIAPVTCGVCKREVGEKVDTAHAWGSWETTDTTHTRSCTLDPGHVESGDHRATGSNVATCQKTATCDSCGRSYGSPADHKLVYNGVADNELAIKETCETCNHEVHAIIESINDDDRIYTGSPFEPYDFVIDPVVGDTWIGEELKLTYENHVNAGDNTAKCTLSSGGASRSVYFSIEPRPLTDAAVTLSGDLTGTYTGLAQGAPTFTLTYNGKTLAEGVDYTLKTPWPAEMKNAGTYTAVVEGKGNFTGERTVSFTIQPAVPDFTAPKAKTLTYNGQGQELVEAGSTSVGQLLYSMAEDGTYGEFIPTPDAAGTYREWYKVAVPEDDANYISSTPAYVDVTIGKAAPTVTEPAPKTGLVYTGEPQDLIEGGSSVHGALSYRLGEAGTWSSEIPTAVDAGNHTVYWQLQGDSNHTDAQGSVSASIARAPLPADLEFTYTEPALTYNGQEQTVAVTLTTPLPGVEAADITLQYSAVPRNAGDYTFGVRIAQSDNYEASEAPLTHESWKFTIAKAQPEIRWEGTGTYTYNAEPQGEAQVILVNGETYGGSVTYTREVNEGDTAAGLPVNVGTFKLTASITEQDNYLSATAEKTVTITAKTVTPTLVPESDVLTYDGEAKTPAVKVMDGQTQIHPGEYTLTYTNNLEPGTAYVSAEDKEGGNYAFSQTLQAVFLILPDDAALDGVTPDNVNAGHEAAIDEILAAMAGKDVSGAGAAAREQWNDLLSRCNGLKEKLTATASKKKAITDAMDNLPEAPKTSELDAITEILDDYDDIEDNLTEAEKTALEEKIGQLEDLRKALADTNAKLKEITDGTDPLEKEDLEFEDKAAIEALQEKADSLKDDPYLTDDQKQTLEEAEEKLAQLAAEFAEADKVTEQLNKLPTDAKPDSKTAVEAYEAAKRAYEDLGSHKDKVDPKAVEKLKALKEKLTDYKITKGSGAWWAKDSGKGLTFTANGYFDNFTGVEINGKLINSRNYTVKSGSTIVTLKASYLQQLKNGKYTIDICYGDGDFEGAASGTFRVAYLEDIPASGDNIFLWIGVAAASTLCLAVMIISARRKKDREES